MNGIIAKIRWIAILIIGIVVLAWGAKDKIAYGKPAIDLNDPKVDWSELKPGDHVSMDIEFMLDYFMYTQDDGKETMRDYPIAKLEEEGDYIYITSFIGVHVAQSKEFSNYDSLVDASINWWNDDSYDAEIEHEPIRVEGILREMNSDQKKYYGEYMDELGYSSSEQDEMANQVIIYQDAGNSASAMLLVGGIVTLIGAVGVALSFIRRK